MENEAESESDSDGNEAVNLGAEGTEKANEDGRE